MDFDKKPPCKTCRPELFEENIEAVEIYSQCSGQWITSTAGLVDINILAVIEVMKIQEVKNQKECLEKVQIIARQIKKALK